MNARLVSIVFAADMRNTLRDRRTWLAMIVIPLLLVPAILVAAPTAIESQYEGLEATPPPVGLVGAEHGPGLVEYLRNSGEVTLIETPDPAGALERSEVWAVLTIGPELESAIEKGESGSVRIEFDAASVESESARSRLQRLVGEYAQAIVAERLAARGVDLSLLSPIATDIRNISSEEKMGGYFLSMIMPMMLAVWAALGGMYAAIDAVAGEKERGTLEPLLATPPARSAIVAAKYLVVVVTSVVASVIAVAGMYVAFLIKPEALVGSEAGEALRFAVPASHVLLMIGVAVLLSAFFGAVELAVSAYARSFREAQSYLSPLSLVIVLPAVFTQFVSPSSASPLLYYVPVINGIFVFKELLLGSIDWGHVMATVASSLVWIVLGLSLTAAVFKKESVLFRV